MKVNQNNFIKLSYNLAKINLGKTKLNPSVGCVVVKDNSVLSSGVTSLNGRPHAEYNALKSNQNLKGSDLYVSMEPCTHYGITPPCINIIEKKKIKRVFFSSYDVDDRTARKSLPKLKSKNIKVFKIYCKDHINFYQSYNQIKKRLIPLVDAKIAISKDYYTIHKKSYWITNPLSRRRAHLIRSEYEAIISTSKSINKDNSRLNCRIKGFNQQKPDLIIVDLKMRLKKNLKIFKDNNSRKIFIITKNRKYKKDPFFKKKNIKIIYTDSFTTKKDFVSLLKKFRKYGHQRILLECGLTFLNTFIKNKLISNLYIFRSSSNLRKKGKNNASLNIIKKIKFKNKINVNLNGDSLYKEKI